MKHSRRCAVFSSCIISYFIGGFTRQLIRWREFPLCFPPPREFREPKVISGLLTYKCIKLSTHIRNLHPQIKTQKWVTGENRFALHSKTFVIFGTSFAIPEFLFPTFLINPAKYKNISSGFGTLLKEHGIKGFFTGWVPTLLGYSAQVAWKFGFYEFFKKSYADIAGLENAAKYKTFIYLAGSASAELIVRIALCPFEAVKVRVQTNPGFAKGISDSFLKFIIAEGTAGLYMGLGPLWGRQTPYTMMKFSCFEIMVEQMYKHIIPIPKDECNKSLQLGVSFAGGPTTGGGALSSRRKSADRIK